MCNENKWNQGVPVTSLLENVFSSTTLNIVFDEAPSSLVFIFLEFKCDNLIDSYFPLVLSLIPDIKKWFTYNDSTLVSLTSLLSLARN